MTAITNIYLYDEEIRFFGPGPYQLLRLVEEKGSIRAASEKMELSYVKALNILKRAEKSLGFPLMEKKIGGKGGGGSQLTPEAFDFLIKFQKYQEKCDVANKQIFQEIFDEKSLKIGCVLMASGAGRRFGSNKLLSDFKGQSLHEKAFDLVSGNLFEKIVVVTRTEEVYQHAKEKGFLAVLHNFQDRNDVIRLGMEQMQDMDACVFCPCDQPLLSKDSLKRLLNAYYGSLDKILRLAWKDIPGTPILFDRKFFDELSNLPCKKGGSYLALKYPNEVRLVQVQKEEELKDIDTREDLEKLLSM